MNEKEGRPGEGVRERGRKGGRKKRENDRKRYQAFLADKESPTLYIKTSVHKTEDD